MMEICTLKSSYIKYNTDIKHRGNNITRPFHQTCFKILQTTSTKVNLKIKASIMYQINNSEKLRKGMQKGMLWLHSSNMNQMLIVQVTINKVRPYFTSNNSNTLY